MKNRQILLLATLTLLMFACEKNDENKTSPDKPGQEVNISQDIKTGDDQVLTITSKDKKATIKFSGNAVPNDFGIPMYPNIDRVEGSVNISGIQNSGKDEFKSTIFFTTDSYDKVTTFYKDQLQSKNTQIMELNMPDGQMTMITIKEAEGMKTVHLMKNTEKDGTNIQIMNIKK